MVLEGAMIILATTALTLFHPGWAFGSMWADAGWNWKNKQARDKEEAWHDAVQEVKSLGSSSTPSSELK
jgi:hypothetical protein